ncbi:MAG: SMP-30/gluconolactonase/LRE family protein [Bacteroidetes bacterium]|nr:SMP-30/gluconolactonase/LRE family protein [Bacteroidota bacterium]
MLKYYTLLLIPVLFSCNQKTEQPAEKYKTIGTIIQYDTALNSIIDTTTKAEIIAEGFKWSEGPVWVEKTQRLLFSDVPANTIYQWTATSGLVTYLQPSGYTGTTPSRCKEPGSNGLILNADTQLVLCQHGNRQVAVMDAALDKPVAKFTAIASSYKGKRFSSPNDGAFDSNGELYFTDPPYGLFTQDDKDSAKEIPFNGVYKIKKDGTVLLQVDSISRPNGIAFFPGQKRLLVSSSDPAKPNWYVFDVMGDSLANGKIFYHAAGYDTAWKGLPDGLKINKQGVVFATGPGGVYFFSSDGKKLGLLHLPDATSNCALSPDEKTLYITNNNYVLRLMLKK